jgi:uncharacterized protein YbjT (DUF2867 family)
MKDSSTVRSRIAVLGASGYIGTRLVPALAEAGYNVRCFVRFPQRLRARLWPTNPRVEVVLADLDDDHLLEEQLRGCTAAFYLVQSMHSTVRDDAARDRALAHRFTEAAARAGVQRIIYVGGLGHDDDNALSGHLASRRDIEHVLRSGDVPVTVFRAGIIIGAGSPSVEILRHLVERLPFHLTPCWVRSECQPISVHDLTQYLVDSLSTPETVGRTFDVGGADIVTFQTLMDIVADERGLPRRPVVAVPVLATILSALWIHLTAGISTRTARQITEGLRERVVVENGDAARLMPHALLTARESIRMALEAGDAPGVETTWPPAGAIHTPAASIP